MSTNYPTSLDNATSLPYPTALSTRESPSLAGLSDNQNDSIIAIQSKLGIGSSTPTNGNLLVGTGVGSSAWSKAAPAGTIVGTTDSQILTNKTLTSPTINSPVISNATISTDLVSGYTVSNTGTVYGVPVTTGVIQTANTVSGAALTASSVQTSAIAASAITGIKIANYNIARHNNGSNITEATAKILTGWVTITPGVNSTGSATITFSSAFTSPPIVVAVYGGDTAGATSTLGSGGINVKQAYADATVITTTTFLAIVATRDSTNWAAGNTCYVQWIAIGI